MQNDPKRVLVAEDNMVLGQVLKQNLERAGFYVEWAKNGRDALTILKSASFDLMVTDLEMPFVNGDLLCIQARNDLGLKDLPMIMCSAKGLEFDVEEMIRRCSLSGFLFKPFSMIELVELARKTLSDADASLAI